MANNSSSDQAILESLETLITEKTKFKLDKLDRSMNLEKSGMDSFARINLVMEIEEHFGFELADNEVAGIETVGDLVDKIQLKTAAA